MKQQRSITPDVSMWIIFLICRPLLLILNHLLVMGSLDAADLATVLGLLSPKLFPNTPSWRGEIVLR